MTITFAVAAADGAEFASSGDRKPLSMGSHLSIVNATAAVRRVEDARNRN